MLRRIRKSSLLIAAFILCLLTLPLVFTEWVRGRGIALFTPLCEWVGNEQPNFNEEGYIRQLMIENEHLRNELEKYYQLIQQETLLQNQVGFLKDILQTSSGDIDLKAHYNDLKRHLQYGLQAIPCQVVYRDPLSWSSSLWVNIGSEDNPEGKLVIAKNSPVLLGNAVVGVLDHVESHQSRVRLITDSGIVPSVRVSRGYQQNFELLTHLQAVISTLEVSKDFSMDTQGRTFVLQFLGDLQKDVKQRYERYLLAKGELHGGGQPLWRTANQKLRGIGFNYDYADAEGPARDLRTGKLQEKSTQNGLSLIEVGDLLVTTGFDGVFPSGFPVAVVTKRFPLEEGAYTYEIEACPVAGNLNTLSQVFVIPPLGFQHTEENNL